MTDIPKEEIEKWHAPEADWLLQQVVDYANKFNMETSVTLQAGGVLVSGKIISGPKYLDKIAEAFGDALSKNPGFEEAGQNVKDLFKLYKKDYDEPEGNAPRNPPSFIHLENARFLISEGMVPTSGDGVLWRGRISEITGFTFAKFG